MKTTVDAGRVFEQVDKYHKLGSLEEVMDALREEIDGILTKHNFERKAMGVTTERTKIHYCRSDGGGVTVELTYGETPTVSVDDLRRANIMYVHDYLSEHFPAFAEQK